MQDNSQINNRINDIKISNNNYVKAGVNSSKSLFSPNGMVAVAKSHYSRLGISGFYTGLVPAIFRAFLVSSVRFYTFETVIHVLGKN